MNQTVTINFYEATKPYGCFSNFSRHEVDVDGQKWPTSEHCFQALKFLDYSDVEAVRAAPTPFEAAMIGRQRGRSLRADWEKIKDEAMLRVLRAKFTQHQELRRVLCSTNGAALVEHTANDSYWGDGGDGSGKNKLGALLQQVRAELVTDEPRLLAPPWSAFPGIEPSDIFWRMGGGEDYLANVSRLLMTMSEQGRAEYEAYFKMPDEWRHSV